jgi:hypothetical protein
MSNGSPNVVDFSIYRKESQGLRLREAAPQPGVGLPGGGGGGTFNGMEARVAKLEGHIEDISGDISALKSDMRDVRDRLPRIEVRLDHLPGKGFIVTAAVVAIGALGSIITLQQQIQSWLGVLHH